jgi:uncharacterized protein
MKSRVTDPHHLDAEAFAQESVRLEGRWPQDELSRLKQSALPESQAEVVWTAEGERREGRAGTAEIWLHLTAETAVTLQCQRCLSPMTTPLTIESSFQFVAGEDAAAALDADSEHDVLALTRELDLLTLVEDELLLAWPIVPRHEQCPQPLTVPVSAEEAVAEKEAHPFAALAALKRGHLPN